MSEQAQQSSPWLRWFPSGDPKFPERWRLLRFERVDAGGNPVGSAVVSLTPSNFPRLFRSERIAQNCADLLNEEEGR